MQILLSNGNVVWTGKNGGQGQNSDYSIIIHNVRNAQGNFDRWDGCWCPEEAVPFLTSIGIKVYKDSVFSSGYCAPGCTWEDHIVPVSGHVQLAHQFFTGERNNQNTKQVLRKWDDE